jgi:tRNA dimethylallyltransferase
MSQPALVAVMGPTGSGKSLLAEALADATGLQLVNADAFQVYRRLDVGTNKPARKGDYELIDVVEPWEEHSVGLWLRSALRVVRTCHDRGQGAIVVGGTGLFVRALFEEYADIQGPPDPEVRGRIRAMDAQKAADELRALDPEADIDWHNPARVKRALERRVSPAAAVDTKLPPFRKLKLALDPPLSALEARLRDRTGRMMDQGWPEEVAALLEAGVGPEDPGMRAIGYQDVTEFVRGASPRSATVEAVFRATRQYAKRQKTWLRTEPSLVRVGSVLDEDVLQTLLARLVRFVCGRDSD